MWVWWGGVSGYGQSEWPAGLGKVSNFRLLGAPNNNLEARCLILRASRKVRALQGSLMVKMDFFAPQVLNSAIT